jgi:hypothetical protein
VPTPNEVQIRTYKSKRAYESDMKRHLEQGWVVQTTTSTSSRRMIGCLFGIVGYWILPRRNVFHVTYVYSPPTPPTPPTAPGPTTI